eukprot:2380909-Amphidinium_carterae.1
MLETFSKGTTHKILHSTVEAEAGQTLVDESATGWPTLKANGEDGQKVAQFGFCASRCRRDCHLASASVYGPGFQPFPAPATLDVPENGCGCPIAFQKPHVDTTGCLLRLVVTSRLWWRLAVFPACLRKQIPQRTPSLPCEYLDNGASLRTCMQEDKETKTCQPAQWTGRREQVCRGFAPLSSFGGDPIEALAPRLGSMTRGGLPTWSVLCTHLRKSSTKMWKISGGGSFHS